MSQEKPDSTLEMMLGTVNRYITDHLEPAIAEVERDDEVRPELLRQLRRIAVDIGLYAHNLPVELGGGGLSFADQCAIGLELGRVPIALRRATGHLPESIGFAQDDQIDWFQKPIVAGEKTVGYALTEPSAGSDLSGLRTRATLDGTEWVINGEKQFISHPDEVDFIIVLAVTNPEAVLRERFTTLIVTRDDAGFELTPRMRLLGWRGYHLGGFHLTDVRVPHARVLGEVNHGFDVLMSSINSTRLSIASHCVGLAQHAMELCGRHVVSRETFGKPLADHEGVQFMLADRHMDVCVGRLILDHAAALGDGIQKGEPFRIAASRAKLYGTEMLGRVVDTVMQLQGAAGVTTELPIERWYRDARVHRIGEGTSEMQRLQIGKSFVNRFRKRA